VAATGEAIDLITRTKFSTDPENPYGRGVAGEAFRTQKPAINPDIVANSGAGRKRSARAACRPASPCPWSRRQEHRRADVLRRQLLGHRREIIALFSRIARTSPLRSIISNAPPRRP
jgi:hypothetical protein